jgi:hypothetical protein
MLSRLLCKYCDKQITPTDRVSMCLAIGQLSCDEGIVPRLVLLANGLIMIKLDYTFSPFAKQMQVG